MNFGRMEELRRAAILHLISHPNARLPEPSAAEAWEPVGPWRAKQQIAEADLEWKASFSSHHPDVLLEKGVHFGVWQYRYSVRRK